MTMEEMRELGAPALPKGQYYHVRSTPMGNAYVAVMQARKYLWDKCLEEVPVKRYDYWGILQDPEECIKDAAEAAAKKSAKNTPEQIWWQVYKELEGDHK